jgi:3-phenylpropionate/trans-cinnamate dioxygenase ferredoxin subunit
MFSSLQAGKPVRIEKNGESICVARVGDQVFAVNDICSHSDASLSEGDITDFIKTYSVTVDGDSVTVEM